MSLPNLSRILRVASADPCRVPDSQSADQEIRRGLERVCRFCRKKRRGAAAVEFAVVVPLFFLLIFGMIEFGRMVMVQQIITNCSREGARVAVLDGAKTDQVESAVNNYLTNASISGGIVSVSPDPPDSASYGDPVAVTVSVPFDQVSWLGKPMSVGSSGSVLPYGRGMNLSATTVMRRETVQ